MLQQPHTALMALASREANDIVANSRKKPLGAWRRLQKRYVPTNRRKKTTPPAYDRFSGKALSPGTANWHRAMGVLRVSLRDEAEEQAARRDQARGSRGDGARGAGETDPQREPLANVWGGAPGNRDVCRGEGRPEDQRCKTWRNLYVVYNRILWTSMQPTLSHPAKKESVDGSTWRVLQVWWCSLSTRLHCTQRQEQAIVWQRHAEQQVMIQEQRERQGQRRKSDDWSLLGWHDGWNQTYGNSASSPSQGGSFDLGAMSSPEWSEWVRMDFDTGAAVNTFLLNFGR